MTTKKGKSTTTKRKGGAKGKADTARTTEGVAYTEVPATSYDPGNTQVGERDLTGFYRFNLEQLMFLKEYAKDVDPKRAASAIGVRKKTLENWLQQPKFKAEIEEIHDVWRLNIKMTAETAAAKHIQLMQELEQDYREADPELRAKFANSRVKASETYLKAAGHFAHGNETQDAQVVINIDLGGDADNEKKVKIDGGKK